MWTDEQKQEVIQFAERRWEAVYSSTGARHSTCLQWVLSTKWAIRKVLNWTKTAMMAGSVNFQIRTESNDDGVGPTHFSYEFFPNEAIVHMMSGVMPEMHCWLMIGGLPEMELVDVTLQYQERQMKEMIGEKWDEELKLPPYLWCPVSQIPKNIIYRPDAFAYKVAQDFVAELHRRVLCESRGTVKSFL